MTDSGLYYGLDLVILRNVILFDKGFLIEHVRRYRWFLTFYRTYERIIEQNIELYQMD